MVTLKDIRNARETIRGKVYRTPLAYGGGLGIGDNARVFLKLENLQRTGAFKIRGVLNKINSLTAAQKKKGVICATSGSHGLGVATVGREQGIAVTVVLPEATPNYKIKKIKALAEVIVEGRTFQESYLFAAKKARREKRVFLHPFDDPFIIAGQGTTALEILEDLPDVEIIVAPIGGGGLLAGILTAVRALRPAVKVIGVEAEGAASMYRSWKDGLVTELPEIKTFAEGIAVKKPGELNFAIVNRWIDDIVLVSDAEIRASVRRLFHDLKVVAEPAGAAAVAAAVKHKGVLAGRKVVCVVTGGNIAPEMLNEIVARRGR